MSSDGTLLRDCSFELTPEYTDVHWGDTWVQPLRSGKAFEWAVTGGLVYALRERGWKVGLPLLGLARGRELFQLRNELPLQHGRQPGHAAAYHSDHSLEDRFVQALIPKFVFEREGRTLSLFREGCPYHLLFGPAAYRDRPDVLLVEGTPTEGFPRYDERDNVVHFAFTTSECTPSGRLRVLAAPMPIIVERTPPDGINLPCLGLIESTVGKTPDVATKQVRRYEELFVRPNESQGTLPALVVSARPLELASWATAIVDVREPESALAGLVAAGDQAARLFELA